MSRSQSLVHARSPLDVRRQRGALPTVLWSLCALAFLCGAAQPLAAQSPPYNDYVVRVSIKHVLSAGGTRSAGAYTTDTQIRGAITQANTALANNGITWRLTVTEILDVAGISQFFDLTDAAEMRALEAAARANPTAFAWNDATINIYVVHDILSGAGGICSFPMTDEIIVINNTDGILNEGVGWLHEIGHYLSLTHTFEDCGPSSQSGGGMPVAGAPGNAAGAACTGAGATHTGLCGAIEACSENCPDTTNVMSYYSFPTSSATLSPCQRGHMEFELFNAAGSRRHVWLRLLCAVNDTTSDPATYPTAVEIGRTQAVLYDVRDKLLAKTPLGARWTKLYYRHGEEMVRITRQSPGLRRRVAALIALASPGLAALAAGDESAERIEIPGPTVALLESVLNAFEEADPTSPLARTIRAERARLDLSRLAGRSYASVWKRVNREAAELEPKAAEKQ